MFSVGSPLDDEADGGGGAAAHVESGKTLGVLDLIGTGRPGDLLVAIEQHANAGRADRMSKTNQTAARIDGDTTADLDIAVFDGLPALSWRRDPEVINCHVFGAGEAVVRFDATQLFDTRDTRASIGVGDGGAHERKHEWLSLAHRDFRLICDGRRSMAPTGDTRQRIQ